ncbi:MAG: hypothetical protein KME56_05025 [Candidatus Thiodiazotropha sp. (ex Ctena orbiculata)]|uniref:Chalcone isomerase domain-containing protein n=1 Tax=Candidatus Thiodiazotropha taylori TaxID=2792791 RepID=A0A944QVT0_9GAMM|nr:hypothetical protein [Candidatus Thiodiazotropha taylori]PVV06262.1 MAG: hypothetical protein B6D82_18380 [gamma proteobacterium symbiont of Ctena orbiculata]MBT2989686.1 hypothetical protein [Candidatus Thiodiazotropha taylori]MBT2995974.1 hypothetical protein [Candidatus Thiodiazotropha taylori]MBT2999290.1 hypothetical protein [Candidatus Thiodiazotropha taylori]
MMMLIPGFVLLIVLGLSAPAVGAETSGDSCMKRVFIHYCLGGSLNRLQQQRPVKMQPIVSGERSGVIYRTGRDKVYVMAFQDRIYKVLQSYDSPSQVALQRLLRRLGNKYGKPQDLGHFPNSMRNLTAKIGAVRRGEGELIYRWQPPGSAWRVELSWTRKLGISLAYLANALDRQQREAAETGL